MHLMNRANLVVSNFRGLLERQYGFVAHVDKPLWQNVDSALGKMTVHEYSSRPRKMACHNYLLYNSLPSGTRDLLGLGLNYCITTKTIDTTTGTFDRFRQDARRIYHLYNNPSETDEDQMALTTYLASTSNLIMNFHPRVGRSR